MRLGLRELGLDPAAGRCSVEVDLRRFDEALGAWVLAPAPVWCLSLRFRDEPLRTWVAGELRVAPEELRALSGPGDWRGLVSAPEGTHSLGRERRPVALAEPFRWEVRGLGEGRIAVRGEARAGDTTIALEGEARLEDVTVHARDAAEAESLLLSAFPPGALGRFGRVEVEGDAEAPVLLVLTRRATPAPPAPPVAAVATRRLELAPGDAPDPERPLVVPGGPRAVLALELSHHAGRLRLEVTVDERSGEDGALAPSLDLPVPPPPWRGLELTDGDGIEAWVGNDAPELLDNRVRLDGPDAAGVVRVEWTARWEGMDEVGRFEAPLWLRAAIPLAP